MLMTLEEAQEFIDTVLDCVDRIKKLSSFYCGTDNNGNVTLYDSSFVFNEQRSIGKTGVYSDEGILYFHEPKSDILTIYLSTNNFSETINIDIPSEIDEAWIFQQSLIYNYDILNYILLVYNMKKSERAPKYIGFSTSMIETVLERLKEIEEKVQ